MAYPAGVITRPVTFGPAFELEDGDVAGMTVSFKATRPGLLWRATGQPAVSVAITRNADDGVEQTISLPVTDQTGWGDGDGNEILPGDDGHVFLYAVSVVFTQNGRTIPGVQPRSKVVPIPQGDLSPLDLDDLIPMTSPGGTVVAVPDIWSAQIAAAEAAALEAAGALIDSASFVANEVESGPAAAVVSANIQRAAGALGIPGESADDAVAINAALANKGAFRGRPGATYNLLTPIVLPSDTTLDMTGCRVNGNPAKNMLRNAASIPARTVTDAATTAGSNVVTSATAAFTSADVGKALGVLGAGSNYGRAGAPGTMYGTITSVTNATTIVLSRNATATKANATLNVFPARDKNIQVIGGSWYAGSKEGVSQSLDGHTFLLRRIDGLAVRPQFMSNTRTSAGTGGGYAVSMGDVTNVEADSIWFNVGSDGVHVQGPAQYISVRDIYGTTGDDMVALTPVDGQSLDGSLLGDVEGDILDVTIGSVYSANSWTAVKLTSGQGSGGNQRKLSRIKVSGVSGSTQKIPINLVNYCGTGTGDVSIEDVQAIANLGTERVLIRSSMTNLTTLRLKNIIWDTNYTSAIPPQHGVIDIAGGSIKSLLINGLIVQNAGSAGGAVGYGVRISGTVSSLILTNLQTPDNPTMFHAVSIYGAAVAIAHMALSNIQHNVQAGNLVNIESTVTTLNVGDIEVSNGFKTNGSIIGSASSATQATKLRLSNWRQTGGNIHGSLTFAVAVTGAAVEIAAASYTAIATSPNGTRYGVTISDAGALVPAAI